MEENLGLESLCHFHKAQTWTFQRHRLENDKCRNETVIKLKLDELFLVYLTSKVGFLGDKGGGL